MMRNSISQYKNIFIGQKNMKTSSFKIRFGLICLLIVFGFTESVAAQEKGVNNVSSANQINKKRIALVIGNGDYGDDIGKLKNPSNDAVDVAETLKNLGFKLVGDKANLDLNLRQTDELVREFGRQIKAGGVGVFYYSGHGIQVNRVNYLIPLGARIEKQQDVPFETLSVDRVLGEMEAAENNLNILILDACRNNPLSRSVRSADKGLAQPERIPTGTYIAFAAKDGQTASDNQQGRNGLYTSELLKNLKQPDLRLEDVFINTRREVRKLSNNSQTPEEYGSVDDVFFFNPKSQSASTVSTNQNGKASNDGEASNIAKTEKQAFVKIQKSNDIVEVRAVLEQYPSSKYAPAAKARLDKLVWESVKSTKNKAKIQAYLDEFQTGQYAAAAKIELGKLNAAETSPKPQPTPNNNGNSAVKPGKGAIRRNSLGIEFVFVPPGSFQMGTNESYPNPDENPLHKVTI
ncbi:MAG: caspase family protein, partial [Pyrinomonadaceae bacterium]|nr:caspase family protein [Pyrinomonadaceae bacterium]